MPRWFAKIDPMSRFRLLFAWLLLTALPLQGFAAASMLFCGIGTLYGAHVQTVHQTMAAASHDHSVHRHGHAVPLEDPSPASTAQLPESPPQCGVCASCCNGIALTDMPEPVAGAALPQAGAGQLFVLIHPRPSTVPERPPRA